MPESVKHMYYVTEDTVSIESQVGGFIIDYKHVRKHHEPERVWQFFNLSTTKETHVVGVHVGEYEKVKDYCKGWLDVKTMLRLSQAVVEASDNRDEDIGTDEQMYDALADLREETARGLAWYLTEEKEENNA